MTQNITIKKFLSRRPVDKELYLKQREEYSKWYKQQSIWKRLWLWKEDRHPDGVYPLTVLDIL